MPEVDLTNCDREPIHIIGHVQPHGALVALDPANHRIVQASQNTQDHFGIPARELLGKSFVELLGAADAETLVEALEAGGLDKNPIYLLTAHVARRGPFHVVAHQIDSCLVLEIDAEGAGDRRTYQTLPRRLLRRFEEAKGSQAYYDAIAEETKALTGFDRVMVYRFSGDGSGLVVAEAAETHLDPFLGLNYPASDIPQQARRLFALNTVRLYPDVDYVPSPLVPGENPITGGPLDMTYCVLRGVSSMHTRYLQNMGVKASMALAITRGEELWGLIACHHYSTRLLPYPTRAACEFLSRLVSLQIADKQAQDGGEYRDAMRNRLERLTARLYAQPDPRDALARGDETILGLMDVGGAALVSSDGIALLGETPSQDEVRALVQWLAENQDEPVWSTSELRTVYPGLPADRAAGLLSIQISGTFVLWFLPEQVQTIDWAGNPEKPVELTEEDGRLSPRGSFELWQTTVAGKSRPWLESEVAVAASLRLALVEALVHRTDEILRLNAELQQRNEDLDAFAHVAAHDLKEPLRGIRNYAQFVDEDYGDRLDEEGRGQLATIVRLSARLEGLLDSLLRFTRVSREELEARRCDLGTAVAEAESLLASTIKAANGSVVVHNPLPVVRGDLDLVIEVFVNLITNALKYNASGAPRIDISSQGTTVVVRDNGIGIPERHRATVFALFKRLHAREAFGGGTGMGLTIVKKAMERLGGRVSLESPSEGGAAFVLEFLP